MNAKEALRHILTSKIPQRSGPGGRGGVERTMQQIDFEKDYATDQILVRLCNRLNFLPTRIVLGVEDSVMEKLDLEDLEPDADHAMELARVREAEHAEMGL